MVQLDEAREDCARSAPRSRIAPGERTILPSTTGQMVQMLIASRGHEPSACLLPACRSSLRHRHHEYHVRLRRSGARMASARPSAQNGAPSCSNFSSKPRAFACWGIDRLAIGGGNACDETFSAGTMSLSIAGIGCSCRRDGIISASSRWRAARMNPWTHYEPMKTRGQQSCSLKQGKRVDGAQCHRRTSYAQHSRYSACWSACFHHRHMRRCACCDRH